MVGFLARMVSNPSKRAQQHNDTVGNKNNLIFKEVKSSIWFLL